MKNLPKLLAWTFAVAFLVAAITGFIPNPLLGNNAFFITNTAHNLVHLVTAIGFAIVAITGEKIAIRFMQIFGIVYMFVGIYGYIYLGTATEGHLLKYIHINWLDNYLHIGLGIVIALAGWISQNYMNQQFSGNRQYLQS